MITKTNILLFIISVFLFSSCEKQVSNEKQILYYTTVGIEMKNTSILVNDFFHQTVKIIKEAQEVHDKKIDSSKITLFTESYHESIFTLSKAINKLTTLKEIDQDINLKEKVLAYYKEVMMLQEATIPHLINVLNNGVDNITDKEREVFKNFQIRTPELQLKANELQKLSLDFQEKHHITEEQLTEYGL